MERVGAAQEGTGHCELAAQADPLSADRAQSLQEGEPDPGKHCPSVKQVVSCQALAASAKHISFHLLLHHLLQVWLPKGTATQTRVNKGQTMPRISQHLAGLQGGPGTQVRLIKLELDLGQPYQY